MSPLKDHSKSAFPLNASLPLKTILQIILVLVTYNRYLNMHWLILSQAKLSECLASGMWIFCYRMCSYDKVPFSAVISLLEINKSPQQPQE